MGERAKQKNNMTTFPPHLHSHTLNKKFCQKQNCLIKLVGATVTLEMYLNPNLYQVRQLKILDSKHYEGRETKKSRHLLV